jgi:hypothetical protein
MFNILIKRWHFNFCFFYNIIILVFKKYSLPVFEIINEFRLEIVINGIVIKLSRFFNIFLRSKILNRIMRGYLRLIEAGKIRGFVCPIN